MHGVHRCSRNCYHNCLCFLLQQRFAPPVNNKELEKRRQDCVPPNTRRCNTWAMKTYRTWVTVRNNNVDTVDKILLPLSDMPKRDLGHWLSKFVVEVRKQEPVGQEYPAKTILSMVIGIQGQLKGWTPPQRPRLQPVQFQEILDAEMKRSTGKGIETTTVSADPILPREEDSLWEKKLLGDFNPRVLLNTIIFMNGKHFALRSGQEHRNLRHKPCQITIQEPPGGAPYLRYSEDISKTQQSGLKHRKITKKEVFFHANLKNPQRCHVRLFRKYLARCPKDGHEGAF